MDLSTMRKSTKGVENTEARLRCLSLRSEFPLHDYHWYDNNRFTNLKYCGRLHSQIGISTFTMSSIYTRNMAN